MKINKTWLALLAALAVLALAVLAAGCGSSSNNTTGGSATGNATDAAFVTDMTSHHQGAIDMAEVAQTRADHPQVRKLAGNIVSAQKAEIAVMKRINDDMHAMGMHTGGHMGMSRHQMGMDMPALKRAKPFDRAFIDMMVPHHQGAIAMAKVELAKGSQPALRTMATNIIAAQSKEIAQMRAWRKAWYEPASGKSGMHGSGHHGAGSSMGMGG